MKAKREAYIRQAFVLDVEEAQKVYRALEEFGPEVEIEIECKDGLNRHLTTLEQLISYENAPSKEIRSIPFSSHGHYNQSARCRFMNKDDSNISILIEGEEEAVVKLNSSLEERLSSMKPWYAFFAKLDFMLIGLGLLIALFLGIAILGAVGIIARGEEVPPEPSFRVRTLTDLLFIAMITSPFILGFLFNQARKKLFPAGVFALGQGKKRHSDREWVRSTIIVGFLVSLAAGIVLLFFSR